MRKWISRLRQKEREAIKSNNTDPIMWSMDDHDFVWGNHPYLLSYASATDDDDLE